MDGSAFALRADRNRPKQWLPALEARRMVAQEKRSYYLPKKLIEAFDRECRQHGVVRQRAAAAAICTFLSASPDARQRMLDNLAKFLTRR